MWYVYILALANGSYYIGSTDNLERRIYEHAQWYVISTKHKGPVRLLYSKSYETLPVARQVEYKLKQTKKRVYVEKFMRWEYLPVTGD